MNRATIELIGLLATGFVLASFLVSGEKWIRKINIFGAAIFVAYGLLIGSPSTYILNGTLFFVHIYKLRKLHKVEIANTRLGGYHVN